MRPVLFLTLAVAAVGAAPAAPPAEVPRVLAAYEAARPAERDLQLYKLDWAASLNEAKARAAREQRPILLISTTQLEDAGDLRGGHC